MSRMDDPLTGYKVVSLDKIMVAARECLPASVAASAHVDVAMDYATDSLVMSLAAYIYGKEQRVTEPFYQRVTYDVPATWWQHVKAAAIVAGNPFIKPEKIRYKRVEKLVMLKVELTRRTWWPDLDIPVQPSWGNRVELVAASPVNWNEVIHAGR